MFKTCSTKLSVVLQLLIDLATNNEMDNNNKRKILSTFFTSKKLTEASYLISDAKKAFNHLQHLLA